MRAITREYWGGNPKTNISQAAERGVLDMAIHPPISCPSSHKYTQAYSLLYISIGFFTMRYLSLEPDAIFIDDALTKNP